MWQAAPRAGVTLIANIDGHIRDVIPKPLHGAREGGLRIPLPELMAALDAQSISYVRRDRGNAQLPKRFKKRQDAKWIDLALPCLCLRTRYDGRCLA